MAAETEMMSEKTFYLTRSVPLHDYCFFIEKPEMLIFRNGNILWTNAEFAVKEHGIQHWIPMLDVPVGKCWEIMITRTSNDTSVVLVVDRDVDVEKHVR